MGGKHLLKSKSDPGKSRTHVKQKNHRPKVKQHQHRSKEQLGENLSFCGCGFLGIYHVGVASCFHEYAPQLSMHKIAGSSAGALVAVAHICGNLQLAYATTDILRVAIDARARALGPFHPSFDINAIISDALERGLPDDVHLRASGKLHISLTRAFDGENVIVNQFDSKQDVIQALICSCFIPFWSGLKAPKYKGITYIDGGFSNNLLILDDKTVSVSPFAGEADICPQDDTFNLLQVSLSNTSFSISPGNLYRLSHALLPPPPEMLSDLCEQGYADGIRFLQQMKLITCTKCLDIRSSLLLTASSEDLEETFANQVHINESLRKTSNVSESRHIRLEQQEQSTIKIDEARKRRDSVVSSNKQIYCQKQPLQRDDSCDECVLIRQKALKNPLPKQFSDRIRDACDTVNKSLSNWIYSHRPIKYLSYLAAPYYLPIDISLALVYKCWQQLPTIRSGLVSCIYDIVDFLIGIVRRMNAKSFSSLLLESSSSWEDDALEYEKELVRQQVKLSSSTSTEISATTTTCECCIDCDNNCKNDGSTCCSATDSSSTTTVESSISVKITMKWCLRI